MEIYLADARPDLAWQLVDRDLAKSLTGGSRKKVRWRCPFKLRANDPREQALNLFVAIGKTQPFDDGNKRTAIFVANGLLIRERTQVLLTVPMDEAPTVPESYLFNDLLARSYLFGEDHGVKRLLRDRGLQSRS